MSKQLEGWISVSVAMPRLTSLFYFCVGTRKIVVGIYSTKMPVQ